MDKRNFQKSDHTDRQKKDRGDLKRPVEKLVKKNLDADTTKVNRERGDSRTLKDKFKTNNKKGEDIKITRNVGDYQTYSGRKEKDVNALTSKTNNIDKRVKRYTLSLGNTDPNLPPICRKENVTKRHTSRVPISGIDFKNDKQMKLHCGLKTKAVSVDRSTDSDDLKQNRREKDTSSIHRKPIIKTVTARNDMTKVYKAVTFVDQKRVKPRIQIKIPNDLKKQSETNTMVRKVSVAVSRCSFKDMPIKKKKNCKQKRLVSSPDLYKRIGSPATEVAKWAPSSINEHTKPYYEAWVNTTLAAISKNSKKDKLFLEKQYILENFQRALLDGQRTPDLVYENINDERYTGRIKVKQR